MIESQRLRLALYQLQLLCQLELGTDEWVRMTDLIRQLRTALRTDNDDAVRTVISALQELGANRGVVGTVPDQARSVMPSEFATEVTRAWDQLDEKASRVTRTPHLDLGVEGPLSPGQLFSVEVYLDIAAPRSGEVVVPFDLPHATGPVLQVDVWLTTSSHFQIIGRPIGQIEVRRFTDRSTSATFKAVVRMETNDDAGPPAIQARFDYRLRAGGSVYREVTIEGLSRSGTTGAGHEVAATPVVIRPRETAPDISVSVVRTDGSVHSYRIKVATELLGGFVAESEWHFTAGSDAYVREVMAGFMDDKASTLARANALRGAGKIFFRQAPDAFKDIYWRLVDADAPPRTMLLVSEERSVPWELMVPERRLPDGTFDTRSPLGAACAVGRWHQNGYYAPGQRVPLDRSLVLAPVYNPPLPKSADERDLVLRLFAGTEVPTTFDEMDAFFQEQAASLLHFVCHGRDATVQAIRLAKGQYLTAEQALGGGLAQSCRASRPLIFLNACELGRAGAGMVSVGGFPLTFMESGASGIVAPLWRVDDEAAHSAAVTFYETVRTDPFVPFAEILRRLRQGGLQPEGQDSHAAYVYYGDPLAAAEVGW